MESLHISDHSKKSVELIFLGTVNLVILVYRRSLPRERRTTGVTRLLYCGSVRRMARNRLTTDSTIVIDVGKNFYASALEWFPKYGLRQIDAVLITHAHADAVNGLDDLRGWTLNGTIQSHIDIYVSQVTFGEVKRCFPYLVSQEYASGGGDVPSFEWHVVKENEPFDIKSTGIKVTPFPVHHGRLFTASPLPAFTPTPNATAPPTPTRAASSIPRPLEFSGQPSTEIHPYICWGFKIDDSVVYLSDVSHIPDDSVLKSVSGTLPVFVLDCLHLARHTSHFGLVDALDTALKVAAQRTYLTGFSHKLSHDEYVTLGKMIQQGSNIITVDTPQATPRVQNGLELIKKYYAELTSLNKQALGKEGIWLRPAHDGLRVFVSAEGVISDETYDQIPSN